MEYTMHLGTDAEPGIMSLDEPAKLRNCPMFDGRRTARVAESFQQAVFTYLLIIFDAEKGTPLEQ
jgi:hypothetical protein